MAIAEDLNKLRDDIQLSEEKFNKGSFVASAEAENYIGELPGIIDIEGAIEEFSGLYEEVMNTIMELIKDIISFIEEMIDMAMSLINKIAELIFGIISAGLGAVGFPIEMKNALIQLFQRACNTTIPGISIDPINAIGLIGVIFGIGCLDDANSFSKSLELFKSNPKLTSKRNELKRLEDNKRLLELSPSVELDTTGKPTGAMKPNPMIPNVVDRIESLSSEIAKDEDVIDQLFANVLPNLISTMTLTPPRPIPTIVDTIADISSTRPAEIATYRTPELPQLFLKLLGNGIVNDIEDANVVEGAIHRTNDRSVHVTQSTTSSTTYIERTTSMYEDTINTRKPISPYISDIDTLIPTLIKPVNDVTDLTSQPANVVDRHIEFKPNSNKTVLSKNKGKYRGEHVYLRPIVNIPKQNLTFEDSTLFIDKHEEINFSITAMPTLLKSIKATESLVTPMSTFDTYATVSKYEKREATDDELKEAINVIHGNVEVADIDKASPYAEQISEEYVNAVNILGTENALALTPRKDKVVPELVTVDSTVPNALSMATSHFLVEEDKPNYLPFVDYMHLINNEAVETDIGASHLFPTMTSLVMNRVVGGVIDKKNFVQLQGKGDKTYTTALEIPSPTTLLSSDIVIDDTELIIESKRLGPAITESIMIQRLYKFRQHKMLLAHHGHTYLNSSGKNIDYRLSNYAEPMLKTMNVRLKAKDGSKLYDKLMHAFTTLNHDLTAAVLMQHTKDNLVFKLLARAKLELTEVTDINTVKEVEDLDILPAVLTQV